MTPAAQEKMAERRRGTYVSASGEQVGRLSAQLGKKVDRFFIDIGSDNRVRLVLECADGELVSNRAFLDGRMSDLSFYWGSAEQGLAARYGVLKGVLAIAFCPQRRPVTFVLNKWCGTLDLSKVRLDAPPVLFCDGCDYREDLFDLVCETNSLACLARQHPSDEKSATIAGYYVRDRNLQCEGALCRTPGNDESRARYWVLTTTGTFWVFESSDSKCFQWQPLLLAAWWNEFQGKVGALGGSVDLYDIRRDEIVVIDTAFGHSQSLDARIVTPGYFRNPMPGTGMSFNEWLDQAIARELNTPGELFRKSRYRRLKDTEENKVLREGLANAVRRQCAQILHRADSAN